MARTAWVLSGNNTYTGPTTVSAGTLQAGTSTAFSQNSAYTVASGAILSLNNFSESIGSLAGAGTVTNGGAATRTLTTGGNNTPMLFSGVIQNGGEGSTSLTKTGSGTFTLSGDKHLHRHNDDQRRHAADRQWRHERLDPRRRDRQRHTQFQSLRWL